MKILVVGQSMPALELLSWLQKLVNGNDDLENWSESIGNLRLEIAQTAKAEEAIELAKNGRDIIFLSLTGIEIPGQTRKTINWGRLRHFDQTEREGAWLLKQIKPSRSCKRKVAVITADPKRIRRLCHSLDLAGVVPASLGPRTKQAILDYLVRINQNKS